MQDAVAIIHFNTWYIHVARTDDGGLVCFKYDEITHDSEFEYFWNMLDASDWVLQPVQGYPTYECLWFTSGVGTAVK
jgi:hypothetical protein